jgi:hypothetical protein
MFHELPTAGTLCVGSCLWWLTFSSTGTLWVARLLFTAAVCSTTCGPSRSTHSAECYKIMKCYAKVKNYET